MQVALAAAAAAVRTASAGRASGRAALSGVAYLALSAADIDAQHIVADALVEDKWIAVAVGRAVLSIPFEAGIFVNVGADLDVACVQPRAIGAALGALVGATAREDALVALADVVGLAVELQAGVGCPVAVGIQSVAYFGDELWAVFGWGAGLPLAGSALAR